MLKEKLRKGNLFESVLDNVLERTKYRMPCIRKTHRNVIGMKRRMQYYQRMKKEIYDPVIREEHFEQKQGADGKNVWFCWLQGLENAPDIVKACYKSVQHQLSLSGDRKLILITEKNMGDYIELPEYIVEKYKKGVIAPACFSDMIRLELLIRYGGIWTDSTVFWTGNEILNLLDKTDLCMPDKWIFFNGEIMKYDNWWIYAKSNQLNLRIVQACLYRYWKKYDYQIDYFLFHLFLAITMQDSPDVVANMPYLCVHSAEFLQMHFYQKKNEQVLTSILNTTDFHKLNYKDQPKNSITGTYYEWILRLYE